MDRLTDVFGTCNGENIYGAAETRIKIRKELEESGEFKNSEALDYFTQVRFENKITTKLGKLEDIEEEIGVDLATLFEVLKERKAFYKGAVIPVYDNPYQVGEYRHSDIRGIELNDLHKSKRGNWCFCSYDFHNKLAPNNLFLKDYGKTWALTKEELEE